MTNRTVDSPAGEPVEIVPDDEWLAVTGDTEQRLSAWHGNKRYAIRELWERGSVHDSKGAATTVLQAAIREHFPQHEMSTGTGFTSLLGNYPLVFKRDVRGKRCYSIELLALPERWYEKVIADIGAFPAVALNGHSPEIPVELHDPELARVIADRSQPIEQPPAAIEPVPTDIADILDDDSGPAIEVEIASQVAMELLTKVVEIISAGSSAGLSDAHMRRLSSDLETVTNRLGQRTEEIDRMRKQVRALGDEVSALKMERDGLRQRLRQTESNLTAALKGESAGAVTTEIMKRVDRIMRESPRPKGDE